MNWEQAIKILVATISGLLSSLFGGFDAWFITLLVFVALDFLTGICKAILSKSEKTDKGGLDSRIMFKGGIKKILIFVVVAVAATLDKVIMSGGNTIRSVAIGYYVAAEGLSILENAGLCGIPFPKIVVNALEQLKIQNDNKR